MQGFKALTHQGLLLTPLLWKPILFALTDPSNYLFLAAIILTILCYMMLIGSEVAIELGVKVSPRCATKTQNGPVVTNCNGTSTVSLAERAASALFLQGVEFLDGPLTSVTVGFPRRINPTTCLRCLKPNATNLIINSCTVDDAKSYSPGSLQIGVMTANTGFETVAIGFNETEQNGLSFSGDGDVTSNNHTCATFIWALDKQERNGTIDLTYLEYADQDHCKSLLNESRKLTKTTGAPTPIWRPTKTTTYTQKIHCRQNSLAPERFQMALGVYRTMQLENTMKQLQFNTRTQRFERITVDDVYRAVLALKMMDHNNASGLYQEYVQCPGYDWQYIMPFATALGSFFLLAIIAFLLRLISIRRGGHDHSFRLVPRSSREWYEQIAMERSQRSLPLCMGSTCTRPGILKWKATPDQVVVIFDAEHGAARVQTITATDIETEGQVVHQRSEEQLQWGHEADPYPL